MVRAIIVEQLVDDRYIYTVGDRVRIQKKNGDEYIGEILKITIESVFIDIKLDTRLIFLCDIKKMRFAKPEENFENTWDF